jgi:LysR family transcriptional regulator for metE and metH
MVPTAAGERLLESARTVLGELRRAEDAVRRGGPRPVLLRFTTECYTLYHWLPAVLKPFRAKFPLVDVQIDPGGTGDPVAQLLDDRIDLALVSSTVKHPRLAVQPLFEDEHVLLVPANHALAAERFLPVDRLGTFRHETFLTYDGADDSDFCNRVLRPAGVMPGRVECVRLTEASIEMVRAGLGVTVLARWAVEPFLRRGGLRALRITPSGWFKEWRGVVRAHEAGEAHLKEFLRLVVATAPSAGPRDVAAADRSSRRPRVANLASRR